jgi:hypothetical protein
MPVSQKKYALRRAAGVDVFEAFRQACYVFGVQKLAPLMGQRPGTLYNKADASDDSHNQPTLRDVVMVTQITGDLRVLDALDSMFNRAAYDCSQHETASDEALLDLLATLGAESGEFHKALAGGLRAQRFTPEAMGAVRAEAMDMVSALMVLVHRLEDYVDE